MRHTLLTLAALVLAPPFLANAAESQPAQPNVIVFLVDDMGWMDCGAYGSKYYETPHIDRFAARAMRFTDAYAQPLCSPTRASLLTGKYSARHAITSATGHLPPQPAGYRFLPDTAGPAQPLLVSQSKNFMEPSEYTLAEALRDAGYRTAHIGKWHLGLTQPYRPAIGRRSLWTSPRGGRWASFVCTFRLAKQDPWKWIGSRCAARVREPSRNGGSLRPGTRGDPP